MKWTESDIQGLKAQEAKDLATEFLRLIQAKEKGPISPGEVQLKELEYDLRLREAEIEDRRQREDHERRVKELELQIEQERTRAAMAESRANDVRQSYARVIERVGEASESLSTRLERAAREHNLKIEQLTAAFAQKQAELDRQIQDLERGRDSLREEIAALTGVRGDAEQVARLQEEIDQRRKDSLRASAEAEEQAAAAEFEKNKRIRDTQRQQELEIARLEADHQKAVLQRNRQAADAICESLSLVAVDKQQWEQFHQRVTGEQQRSDQEREQIRTEAREAFRREFNITRKESVDVTDLFYREQTARTEVESLRQTIDKQDAEIRRMRQHIEQEPQRIAAAIEAAKTQVQNFIEQSGKR